jgi:PPM family protein phosphatase
MKLQAESFSHIGHVREKNEDALLVRAPEGLFAVADGMGGHADGEIASQLCTFTLGEALRELHPLASLPPHFEMTERRQALASAIVVVNEVVHREAVRLARKRRSDRLMGTTVAALLFGPRSVVVGHLGDSRAYLLRDRALYPLTTDHTIGNAVRASSGQDAAATLDPDYAAALTDAVGVAPAAAPSVTVKEVLPGDVLLLCTDGLHGEVPAHEIARILQYATSPGAALLEAALAAGGRDNVSGIVVRIG